MLVLKFIILICTNNARANFPYSVFEDVNGNFVVRNLNAENSEIEADYAWVYFSLSAPSFRINKEIYINECSTITT
jgi:hypothetical protein